MSRPSPGNARRTVAFVVAAAVLLAFLQRDALGMSYGPTCIVGIAGTAASVQAQGWLAGTACDALAGSSTSTYRFSGTLTTPVICQYDIDGVRYTVHDDGALKLFGIAICSEVQKSGSRGAAQRAVAEQASSVATTFTAISTSSPAPRTPSPVVTVAATPFIPTLAPATAPPAALALSGCEVGVTGHDMALRVIGRDPMTLCRQLASVIVLPAQARWFVPGTTAGVLPSASSAVCTRTIGDHTTIITDYGSKYYGTAACWQLQLLDARALTFPESCGLAVPDHNATVAIVGTGAVRQCAYLLNTFKTKSIRSWQRADASVRSGPYAMSTICRLSAATVSVEIWDTGGAIYGTEICGSLSAASFAR